MSAYSHRPFQSLKRNPAGAALLLHRTPSMSPSPGPVHLPSHSTAQTPRDPRGEFPVAYLPASWPACYLSTSLLSAPLQHIFWEGSQSLTRNSEIWKVMRTASFIFKIIWGKWTWTYVRPFRDSADPACTNTHLHGRRNSDILHGGAAPQATWR